jgi:hypothetical protein
VYSGVVYGHSGDRASSHRRRKAGREAVLRNLSTSANVLTRCDALSSSEAPLAWLPALAADTMRYPPERSSNALRPRAARRRHTTTSMPSRRRWARFMPSRARRRRFGGHIRMCCRAYRRAPSRRGAGAIQPHTNTSRTSSARVAKSRTSIPPRTSHLNLAPIPQSEQRPSGRSAVRASGDLYEHWGAVATSLPIGNMARLRSALEGRPLEVLGCPRGNATHCVNDHRLRRQVRSRHQRTPRHPEAGCTNL